MRVIRIVCHDGQVFVCKTHSELITFIQNYRLHNEKRIKTHFPDNPFLVRYLENKEMTEEEYNKLVSTSDSAKYFNTSDVL